MATAARKSAPKKVAAKKTAGKGKATAKAKAKPRRRRAKKTDQADATTQLQAVLTTPAVELAEKAQEPERQFSRDDFRMSIDDMEPPRLRAYARSIGILQRDVDGLSEDRLRQNCKARVAVMLED